MASACGYAQINSCLSKCGNLTVLSCDYNSSGGNSAVLCTCGCDSGLLAEYGDIACQAATRAGAWNCSSGGHCSFSHCTIKDFYCFSYEQKSCDSGNIRCRKVYLIDAAATSQACGCRYASSYSGGFEECKDYVYYGSACQYTCPSYMYSAAMYVNGKRSTKNLGGAQTDCRVTVPAGCDSSGCYDGHTCPWNS